MKKNAFIESKYSPTKQRGPRVYQCLNNGHEKAMIVQSTVHAVASKQRGTNANYLK